jgi:hypothetical protein
MRHHQVLAREVCSIGHSKQRLGATSLQSNAWQAITNSAGWLTAHIVLAHALTSQIQRHDQRIQQVKERIELN